jgi:hypothetical protein
MQTDPSRGLQVTSLDSTLASGSYADPFEHGGVEFGYGEDAFTLRWPRSAAVGGKYGCRMYRSDRGLPEERYDDR